MISVLFVMVEIEIIGTVCICCMNRWCVKLADLSVIYVVVLSTVIQGDGVLCSEILEWL